MSRLLTACQLVAKAMSISLAPLPEYLTDKKIEEIAQAGKFRVRQVNLSGNWWNYDNGPLLVFNKKGQQAYALLLSPNSTYQLVDPVTLDAQPLTSILAETLAPEAYYFYRSFPDNALGWRDIFHFTRQGLKNDFIKTMLLQGAISLGFLLIPIAMGNIFSDAVPNADNSSLWQWIIALTVNALVITAFNFSQSITLWRLYFKTDVALQSALWDRLLRLPVNFFRQFSVGDLALRSDSVDRIQQVLTSALLNGLMKGAFALFPLVLMFYYDTILALEMFLITFLIVTTYGFILRWQLKYQRDLLQVRSDLASWVLQVLTSISKLRIANAEERAFKIWSNNFCESVKLFFKSEKLTIKFEIFDTAAALVTTLLLFIFVIIRGNTLSFGDFIAFNAAFGLFFSTLATTVDTLVKTITVIPLYERAQPILTTLPEQASVGFNPGQLTGQIEIREISYHYPATSLLVLQNFSLTIQAGEAIAIVGPSGAGKSTLVRLLLGFEQPTNGTIFYDNHELATLDLRALRRQFGVILQQDALLPGTIFENICGATALSFEQAWQAARLAAFDKDIEAMPMGMHTILSEDGKTLSVGQRQRLLLARALVHQPRILILDEATSALDNVTQTQVHANLRQQGITRIIIAHRLSTIRNVDRIYVLDQGKLVQSGTYQSLLNEPGLFAQLVHRQTA